MQLIAVSISHEKAPLSIREKVSFTKRRQAEILQYIKQNIADECVIVSTCNRCEFYLAGDNIEEKFLDYLVSLTDSDIKNYAVIYENYDCCEHIMLTASGLKSMILGEDQILGQVKDAHEFAMANSSCGKFLNTLFRIAITGAKKVKTKTLLSKTPLSAATIAIKLCQSILGTLNNKNVLIIGASGKTGSIILKGLLSLGSVNVYVTSRTHGDKINKTDGAVTINYEHRYDNFDIYDAVISATSSPHIVLENSKIQAALNSQKQRVFIDLAVPHDIDIKSNEHIIYKDIDDLLEIAENNNKIKILETEKAKTILSEYIDRFLIWKLFTENEPLLKRLEKSFKSEHEKNKFRHDVYNLKDENNYKKFCGFINSLREECR